MPGIAAALAALVRPGLSLAHKAIMPGDEHALLPNEAKLFERSVLSVRRQSGAVRIAARQLLAVHGSPGAELVRGPSFGPVWPPGLVGSLAHDATWAVAAVGERSRFAGVGVDVEPDLSLPAGILHLVATPAERRRVARDVLDSRVLFVMKEAVFKAVNPLDRIALDFQDIELDLAAGTALVSNGRRVTVDVARGHQIIAVAFVAAADR